MIGVRAFLLLLAPGLSLAALRAQEPPALSFTIATTLDPPPGEHLLACGDYDGDGDPDLLLDGRTLFRNDSAKESVRFTNVTEAAGLQKARGPSGCWFDFDRDGLLDFGTSSGEIWLQGEKGRFVDFTAILGLAFPHGATSAAAWGDLDGDGWLDCLSGGDNQYTPSQHFAQSCWLNSPRKGPLAKRTRERELQAVAKLRDGSARLGTPPLAYGRAVVFCDFDWDGDDDVYTGNYHLAANFLWRNDGDRLREVGGEYGVAGRSDPTMFALPDGKTVGYQYGHTIGASWADLDNDGYFDLFVANLVHKYVGPVGDEFAKVLGSKHDTRGYVCDDSNVFVNGGPPDFHFTDWRVQMGIPVRPIGDRTVFRGDELWSNAVCADFDGNGFADVFCNQVYAHVDYAHGVLFANRGGTFTECHAEAGIKMWGGYGGAAADVDSDGRVDLIVSGADQPNGAAAVRVFRNTGPAAPWLGLRIPPRAGQQVIGTKVLLVQERAVQLRQLATTMGSHGQQSEGRVHFGLGGDGGAVRDVVVYWPGGRVQSLGALPPGRYHEVKGPVPQPFALQLRGPAQGLVGSALEFRIGNDARGSRYEWDFGGSRLPEVVGAEPVVAHGFDAPGRHWVWVRAVRPGGACAEARLVVDVKEE